MKKIAAIIFGIIIIVSLYFLYQYINFTKHNSSTNALFVKSESLTFLSFKIPGKIEKIYKNEGDKIKKGEILAKLETKELTTQKKEIINEINALISKIEATKIEIDKVNFEIDKKISILQKELEKLQKIISSKESAIKAKEIEVEKLKKDYDRFKTLYQKGRVSKEDYEKIQTKYLAQKEILKSKRNGLEGLKKDIEILKIKIKLAQNSKKNIKELQKKLIALQNQKKALEKKLELVNLNIKNSFIISPFDGVIAKRFANEKEVIGSGIRVFSVVNPNDLYALVLLEETKLNGIKKGCKAIIHIDALDKDFKGEVEDILPVSAATFALIPRNISAGEFTKLTQRFYVKVKFLKIPKNLLVGMSGEITIKKCAK
jgi:membrane fusion protein (multidrug efflux system)